MADNPKGYVTLTDYENVTYDQVPAENYLDLSPTDSNFDEDQLIYENVSRCSSQIPGTSDVSARQPIKTRPLVAPKPKVKANTSNDLPTAKVIKVPSFKDDKSGGMSFDFLVDTGNRTVPLPPGAHAGLTAKQQKQTSQRPVEPPNEGTAPEVIPADGNVTAPSAPYGEEMYANPTVYMEDPLPLSMLKAADSETTRDDSDGSREEKPSRQSARKKDKAEKPPSEIPEEASGVQFTTGLSIRDCLLPLAVALVFVLSAASNIFLVLKIFANEEEGMPTPRETGFALVLDEWKRTGLGSTANQAALMNVGSLHAGASCAGSSSVQDISAVRGALFYRCHLALDGRVYDPSQGNFTLKATRWIAKDETVGAWMTVRLLATYHIATVEIVQRTEYAQIEAIELAFTKRDTSQEVPQEFNLTQFNLTQPINRTAEGLTVHRVVLDDPVRASDVRLTVLQVDDTGIKTTNVEELRIFGYGDIPEQCCTTDFDLYSPELRSCFHVSTPGHYTDAVALQKCHNMAANLVTLNSQSQCVLLLPYISQYHVVTGETTSQHYWDKCPHGDKYPEDFARNASLPQVFVCATKSFCRE